MVKLTSSFNHLVNASYLSSFPVFSGSIEELIRSFKDVLSQNKFTSCVTLNAEMFVVAQQSDRLKSRLLNATWITADGVGIIHALRLLNQPAVKRITGSDICHALAKSACFSIYLLGSKKSVLDKVQQNLKKGYPDLQIKGAHHGYIDESDFQNIVDDIVALNVQILFLLEWGLKSKNYLLTTVDKNLILVLR